MSGNDEPASPSRIINEDEDYGNHIVFDGTDDVFDYNDYGEPYDDDFGASYVVKNYSQDSITDKSSKRPEDETLSSSFVGKAIRLSLDSTTNEAKNMDFHEDNAEASASQIIPMTPQKRIRQDLDLRRSLDGPPEPKKVRSDEDLHSDDTLKLRVNSEIFEIKVPEAIHRDSKIAKSAKIVLNRYQADDESASLPKQFTESPRNALDHSRIRDSAKLTPTKTARSARVLFDHNREEDEATTSTASRETREIPPVRDEPMQLQLIDHTYGLPRAEKEPTTIPLSQKSENFCRSENSKTTESPRSALINSRPNDLFTTVQLAQKSPILPQEIETPTSQSSSDVSGNPWVPLEAQNFPWTENLNRVPQAEIEPSTSQISSDVSNDPWIPNEVQNFPSTQSIAHVPRAENQPTTSRASTYVSNSPRAPGKANTVTLTQGIYKLSKAWDQVSSPQNIENISRRELERKSSQPPYHTFSSSPVGSPARRQPFSPLSQSAFNHSPKRDEKPKPTAQISPILSQPRQVPAIQNKQPTVDSSQLPRMDLEPYATPSGSNLARSKLHSMQMNRENIPNLGCVKAEPKGKQKQKSNYKYSRLDEKDEDSDISKDSDEDLDDTQTSDDDFTHDPDYDIYEGLPTPMFRNGSLEMDSSFLMPKGKMKKLGIKGQETLNREQEAIIDSLKELHGSMVGRPTEDTKAEDPPGLKISLMPHQQHALAWLSWRESQKPPGGILADDMGLGKTLTMISLILYSKANMGKKDEEEKKDWESCTRRDQRNLGGTLIIVPASLVDQWASEIRSRVVRGSVSVNVYYGDRREKSVQRLSNYDIVITSYGLASHQNKFTGIFYKIRWRRIILDEAHIIRNHKSQTSAAICELTANRRWALTGTPIHNRALDLYAILKFLQCSPFDDLKHWRRWVDNRDPMGTARLGTIMTTIMLRRTKEELMANGSIEPLPDKNVELIEVQLDTDERLIYEKVMVYSRTLFSQYLDQQATKRAQAGLGTWTRPNGNSAFTKAQKKVLSKHADIQLYWILVLILRLRQICCHPSLIRSMLDKEDYEREGMCPTNATTNDEALMQINDLLLHDKNEDDDEDSDGETGVDERINERLLVSDNPVFAHQRQSSKIRAVVSKALEIVEKGDKVIIVSQWVSFLNIVADQLSGLTTYGMFTGEVTVENRQIIVNNFNTRKNPKILLLSLTAGGVGLNLVGANHLLLIDIHWNPQLENQAQDRIYRFGQKKEVFIYKYICTDSIEMRVKQLQDKKLAVASAVLTGAKVDNTKLSLDDIKILFGL